MRCKADGNGLVYSSPDQVSDDACTQDRRADNRGRDSGVEGAADDVLDGCLLEMDAPLDEKSCLGGDLSFDEFELRDGPEGGVTQEGLFLTPLHVDAFAGLWPCGPTPAKCEIVDAQEIRGVAH